MMFLALLSPLLAFPIVLAMQLLETWALRPARDERRLGRGQRRDG